MKHLSHLIAAFPMQDFHLLEDAGFAWRT